MALFVDIFRTFTRNVKGTQIDSCIQTVEGAVANNWERETQWAQYIMAYVVYTYIASS